MNEHKFARMSHHEQTLHEIRQQIKTGLAKSKWKICLLYPLVFIGRVYVFVVLMWLLPADGIFWRMINGAILGMYCVCMFFQV